MIKLTASYRRRFAPRGMPLGHFNKIVINLRRYLAVPEKRDETYLTTPTRMPSTLTHGASRQRVRASSHANNLLQPSPGATSRGRPKQENPPSTLRQEPLLGTDMLSDPFAPDPPQFQSSEPRSVPATSTSISVAEEEPTHQPSAYELRYAPSQSGDISLM